MRAPVTLFVLLLLTSAGAQSTKPSSRPQQKALTPMTTRVSGPFDVKVTPQQPDSDVAKAANVGRMTIDKKFHGPLEATSKGEMLAVQGDVKGSAGYVAMERVTGTLNGKKGTFVLQHTATMDRGQPFLTITVVPDSGTDELKGISGWMNIVIEGSKHFYEFNFEFKPEAKAIEPKK